MTDSVEKLLSEAWKIREKAYVIGPTRVGCALLAESRKVFVGCNVEHRYRSHDIHAEINAISSMIAGGENHILAMAIAAERERFTPCGACMDWIFQFADPEHCDLICQTVPNGEVVTYRLHDLMPFYPR
jgi:cytidine deaminase